MPAKMEKNRCIFGELTCFFTSFFILMILFTIYHYAPFGNNSLATMDANIQYIDFFAYLKDVLVGKNNISYSFGKTLGGTNAAVFSYYLASPLNLLVIFFSKSNLHSFFDILVAIKCGIAAVTMHIFLRERFSVSQSEKSKKVFCYLLSVCYSLSQYSLAQSSNIMWLEGVYLLPLILLGVYRLIYYQKRGFLSVAVGLSIIFNWYTGGINCLFSAIWFFFELFNYRLMNHNKDNTNSSILRTIINYTISMTIGICLSAVLFFPTIAALKKSGRGSLNVGLLKDYSFTGPIVSAIEAYSLGAKSSYGRVSLYCGSIVIIGCISFFFKKEIDKKQKVYFGSFLAFTLMLFYWRPLFILFSLFKSADSYWYRYSYVGIFALVFIAANFYLQYMHWEDWFTIAKSGVFFATLLLLVNYTRSAENMRWIQYSAVIMGIVGCLCGVSIYLYHSRSAGYKTVSLCLTCMVIIECAYSSKLLMTEYHTSDVGEYRKYSQATEEQVNRVQKSDNEIYRISQTSTRNMGTDNLTAYYNEALAYNYWSISGYTSSPDDIQRDLLNRLGYRENGGNLCIVNTSIISADALLGVKYIFSEYPIKGYEKLKENVYNNKSTYLNPYVLPMAFTYKQQKDITESTSENPFEYQNQLYSQLVGRNLKIFVPLSYRKILNKNGSITYNIKLPNNNQVIYGNLPWNSEFDGILDINDKYKTRYACWLSPSVFYVPTEKGDKEARITVTSSNTVDLKQGDEQFYALDLDTLSEVVKKLQAKRADSISMTNGNVAIHTQAKNGESLYVSVPFDSGWAVTVNGKKVSPELFADCMYSIELVDGENDIQMKYQVPGYRLGVIVSIIGVLGVFGLVLQQKRGKKHRRG